MAVAALCLVWRAATATHGFFSGDSGMKFAQAVAIEQSGFRSRAIPYDHDLDPAGKYRPFQDLTIEVRGERQGIYSWVFTGISALLIAVFGFAGTSLLPLLGGLLTLAGVFRFLDRSGCAPATSTAAAVAATFASPLLFYSTQFAAHSLAAGLIILALSFWSGESRSALWAGLLVGLAATIRPEAYCAVAAMGVAVVVDCPGGWRGRLRAGALYLAGCLPVLAVFWLVNLHSAGVWDLAVYRNRHRSSSIANATLMLVGWVPHRKGPRWLAIYAAAALVGLLPRRRAVRACAAFAVLVGLIAVCWHAHTRAHGRTLVGLFSVTPFAAVGLLAGPVEARWRSGWIVAVAFAAQVLRFDTSGTGGGLQLGARLLLPALPILVALGFGLVEEWVRGGRGGNLPKRALSLGSAGAAATLAVMSVVFLVPGYRGAESIARVGEVAVGRIHQLPADSVLTFQQWEPEVLAPLLLDGKKLYYARHGAGRLLTELAAHGQKTFVLTRKGPVHWLIGGRTLHTVKSYGGWLPIQLVKLDDRPAPSRRRRAPHLRNAPPPAPGAASSRRK